MKRAFAFVAAALLVGCAPAEERWVNGINLPWIDFGKDFGRGKSVPEMEKAFAEFEAAGIDSVRVWIHCDGRRNPLFETPGGKVAGLPDGFMKDFGAMLDAAHRHGVSVMPALWSFDMVKDRRKEGDSGSCAGIQHALLLKDDHLESYVEKALSPMVRAFDAHPALFAWEICNEPEWMVVNHEIPKERVLRFHGRIAAAIHKDGSKPVTTGSASLKWHTDRLEGAKGNWWSDDSLRAAYDDAGAFLDFYQVHVYDWMLPHGFDPYAHTPAELGLNKPVMIGEAPGMRMGDYSPEDMLRAAREKGYFGHYFWSYRAHDGHGEWDVIRRASTAAGVAK